MNNIKIIPDPLESNVIKHLLQTHLNLMHSQSPACSVHALPLDKLRANDVSFWSIWEGEELLGCGALKEINPKHGEIKSMHIYQKHRGRGISKVMLSHIIQIAISRGYERLSLETGSQNEFATARALYKNSGFRECPPFEGYKDDPNSTFMTREI
jgi:putative acetyltransferase